MKTRKERLTELLKTLKDKQASPELIASVRYALDNLTNITANERW